MYSVSNYLKIFVIFLKCAIRRNYFYAVGIARWMISLRRATPEDAGLLVIWFNDRENTRYMEDTRESYDEDYVRERLEPYDFIIMLDEKPIGYCSLYDLDRGSAEVSMLIGERDALGKGYGKRALDALCAFAFGDLGLRELCSSIDEDNLPSIRMAEASGFSRIGKRGRDILFVKRIS